MWITLALTLVALYVLVREKLPMDLVGIGIIVVLAVSGVLDPGQAVSGFANRAVITVGALFIVGEGILKTGAVSFIARRIIAASGGTTIGILILTTVFVGTVSMFLNNTPVVIVFIPLLLGIASEKRIFPSKILIPLSYASILGGSCTLIGTSTNILVSTASESHGMPPIAMFELMKLGLILFAIGGVYLATIGQRLLPERHSLTTDAPGGKIREFVTEVEVLAGSPKIGTSIADVFGQAGARPLSIIRGEEMYWPPFDEHVIHEGDVLILQGSLNTIAELETRQGIRILPDIKDETLRFEPKTMSFVELVVSPNSGLLRSPVSSIGLRDKADLVPIAIMRHGRHIRGKISNIRLEPGDVLLAFGSEAGIREVARGGDFLLMEGIHEAYVNRAKAPIAGLILLGVMITLSTGMIPMEIAGLAGAFLMILTGCLKAKQAYEAINWPILLLVAGTLALGEALEITGAAALIGQPLVAVGMAFGPWIALSALYLATSIVTAVLSNNATAVLLVPVALAIANALGVDSRPFVITIAFAASAAFATPLGYQTNLLVYGPGGYRFSDFLKVGGPLTLILWVVASLLIPVFWKF